LTANRTQSKFIEHHACPMHDGSTALDDEVGLEVVDDGETAGTATSTRRRLGLRPSDRRHYDPPTDVASSSSRRRTAERRRPPDAVDVPAASTFLLLLVLACILLTMLVVGSLSYCAAVRSD